MNLPKVILYYIFTPLSDPAAIKIWQKNLCQSLNLKGRIIISPHGINGTLGGEMNDLKKYIRQTRSYEGFAKMKFKWSEGTGNDFPKLSVKVRAELVAFGYPNEIKVDKNGVVGGGKHLKPAQVDELVAKHGDDVVFFDGRNAYEAKVGRFKNAVVPQVETSRDFVQEIESGKYDHLKDDNRMSIEFSEKTKSIANCEKCDAPANRFYDCPKPPCNSLNLLCSKCAEKMNDEICKHPQRKYSKAELIG